MKKFLSVFILLLSCIIFSGLIFISSPYRTLRPYEIFGRKISDNSSNTLITGNGRIAVFIESNDAHEAFYIEQIPVTVGAYKDCTVSRFCQTQHYRDYYAQFWTSDFYNSFPMSFVTWNEARTYCQAYGGDLPTADQWMIAAGEGAYPWGNDQPSISRANIDGYYQWQIPAGWLPDGASEFGVLDLAGNVREWVLDVNPDEPEEKALKGGGFQDPFSAGQIEFAYYHGPTSSGFNRGFRCVYPVQ